ncbi:hypothetical protein SLS58_000620 [Diplodia intermedia]|uniref:Uncharacterized protein n=1 Tax=Diplodia intermedia TaxID=856260 RepID=A0ABR3U430_9PEZI
MQIAEVLSDLTSLRVCDPAAALALVSATTTTTTSSSSTNPATELKSTTTGGNEAPPENDNNNNNKTAREKGDDDAGEEEEDVDLRRARDLLTLRTVFKQESGAGLAAELGRWREEVRRRMMAVAGEGGFAGVTAESDGFRQGGEGDEDEEGFEDWA